MTKAMRQGSARSARTLMLCIPALLLGACVGPDAVQHAQATADQALATANAAQATANQALATAQQASADAAAAKETVERIYNRNLRK